MPRTAVRPRAMLVVATLLAVRVMIPVALVGTKLSFDLNSADVQRTWQIAHRPGVPYRDFPLEYAPITTIVDRTVLATTLERTEGRLALFNLLCDAAIVLALATWGLPAVAFYSVLSLPLVALAYFRTDLLPAAFLMAGLAFVERGKDRTGGIALALGYFAKLWPAIAVPPLLMKRPRAAWTAIATGVAGTLAWIAFAPAGPWQVLSLRGASGWQIESTVGGVLLLFGGTRRMEAGAVRVGGTLPGVRPALVALICVALVVVWLRHRGVLATTLATISVLLFLSPLLSPQFVVWLLPLAAILAVRNELDFVWPMLVTTLTILLVALQVLAAARPFLFAIVVLVRNSLLLMLAWDALRHERPPSRLGRWMHSITYQPAES